MERYTLVAYGKRKTWIVGGCLCIGILLLLMAQTTDELHQLQFAFLYFVLLTFSAAQSLSVIALAIKELQEPAKIGLIQ